jgi:hypothetical protein
MTTKMTTAAAIDLVNQYGRVMCQPNLLETLELMYMAHRENTLTSTQRLAFDIVMDEMAALVGPA